MGGEPGCPPQTVNLVLSPTPSSAWPCPGREAPSLHWKGLHLQRFPCCPGAGHCTQVGLPTYPRTWEYSCCRSPCTNREQICVPTGGCPVWQAPIPGAGLVSPVGGGWGCQPGAKPGDLPEMVKGPSPLSQPAVPRARPWKPWRPV